MAQNKARGRTERIISDIFGTVEFPLKAHVSPHGRVTAVSMMKDEGPFVLEWVAHHLAVGFTDLVVYTNDCSDGTDDMLIRLEELGLAHHRRNDIPEGQRPQPSALNYAQDEPLVGASDWVLVFDADEFLCIRHGDGSLDGMISDAKEAGANGIVITWRTFGSGGIQEWSRAPVTEQYLYAAPTMWNKGWGVKTLFQFDPDYWKLGIHRPKIKNKHLKTGFPDTVHWLNGSGRPMEDYFKFRGWRSIVRTVGYDWVQMNHYAVKSIDSYVLRKLRGNVNNKKNKYNHEYWSLQDRNEVRDDSILRHSERRAEIMAQLLEDPVLNKLHFNAVERAEARLAEFKATPDYAQLVADIEEASKIPITQVSAKPPQPRDKEKIAALMSDVEKKRNLKPKSERRHASHPDWGKASDIYVRGHIDLSNDPALEVFENKDLKIPADPRVFSPFALQVIAQGKFERNSARRVPKLVPDGGGYLEIGAGVAFLPAVISRERPDVTVIAQEDSPALVATAARIWKMNGLVPGEKLQLRDTALFDPTDGQDTASGLARLIRETGCDVLQINDPRITAKMLAAALADLEKHPRAIILGARALDGRLDQAAATERLAAAGYHPLPENPLATALLLLRQGAESRSASSD